MTLIASKNAHRHLAIIPMKFNLHPEKHIQNIIKKVNMQIIGHSMELMNYTHITLKLIIVVLNADASKT